MAKKKKPPRSAAKATQSFFRNLVAGEHGPLDRVRKIAGNLARRGGSRQATCCGHYGDPGC